jgi:ABC exporter DevB family membrane fusion protein
MARKLGILLIAATATAGGLGLAYYARTTPLALVGDSFAQATLPKTGVVRVTLDSGIVAAPGRVEPRSEEVTLASEISGRITKIHVSEGDKVTAGQVVAELDNSVARARLAEAEAFVHQKEAELRRVTNGAHEQERREALAAVHEAEAVVKNSASELARREALAKTGVTSDEQVQKLQAAHASAKARLDAARSRHALLVAPTREEDVSRARADLDLARARADEARAQLQRTVIRSPIDGTVLRRIRKAGEVVSEIRDTSILTVGDVSALRVRADVDEADIGRVAVGGKVQVKADAFGDQKFPGRVLRIGQMLGRKNFVSETPGEKLDTKVLEVVVELDAPGPLMPGLRVDVFFETKPES